MARVVASWITDVTNQANTLSDTGWGPGAASIHTQGIVTYNGIDTTNSFILVLNVEDQNERVEQGNPYYFQWSTNIDGPYTQFNTNSALDLYLYGTASDLTQGGAARADSLVAADVLTNAFDAGFDDIENTTNQTAIVDVRRGRGESAVAINATNAVQDTTYYFRWFAEGKDSNHQLVLPIRFTPSIPAGTTHLFTSQHTGGVAETQADIASSIAFLSESIGAAESDTFVAINKTLNSISESQAIQQSNLAFAIAGKADITGVTETISTVQASISLASTIEGQAVVESDIASAFALSSENVGVSEISCSLNVSHSLSSDILSVAISESTPTTAATRVLSADILSVADSQSSAALSVLQVGNIESVADSQSSAALSIAQTADGLGVAEVTSIAVESDSVTASSIGLTETESAVSASFNMVATVSAEVASQSSASLSVSSDSVLLGVSTSESFLVKQSNVLASSLGLAETDSEVTTATETALAATSEGQGVSSSTVSISASLLTDALSLAVSESIVVKTNTVSAIILGVAETSGFIETAAEVSVFGTVVSTAESESVVSLDIAQVSDETIGVSESQSAQAIASDYAAVVIGQCVSESSLFIQHAVVSEVENQSTSESILTIEHSITSDIVGVAEVTSDVSFIGESLFSGESVAVAISESNVQVLYALLTESIGVSEVDSNIGLDLQGTAVIESEAISQSAATVDALLELSADSEGIALSDSEITRIISFSSEVVGSATSECLLSEQDAVSGEVIAEASTEVVLSLELSASLDTEGVAETTADAVTSASILNQGEIQGQGLSESNADLDISIASEIEASSEAICSIEIVGIIELSSSTTGVSESSSSVVEQDNLLGSVISVSEINVALSLMTTLSAETISKTITSAELELDVRVAPRIKDSVSQGTAFDKRRAISASDPDVPGAASDTITDIHPSDGIWGQQ